MPSELKVIDHPLVQHKLTNLRDRDTSTGPFRMLVQELSMHLAYEVTHDFPLVEKEIETPLAKVNAPVLDGDHIVFVSILRAGNGILEGMLRILPSAGVGHIGLYRDPKTLQAVEYYFKMPPDMDKRDAIVVDPMLATGHSASAAVDRVKQTNPKSIRFCCILAAPEGIETFQRYHPDVPIFTASVDECLNDHGYIVPGLGDAGDRLYGTA